MLSGNPGFTTIDIREAFAATALDLTPAGFDVRTGAGIVRADHVLDYTGATPQPLVRAGAPTVTPLTGDGDDFLEPGETANLALPVTNEGDGTATGISVTVSAGDAQVTIAPRARSYGDLAPAATTSHDFQLTLAPDYPRGKPGSLAVRVTFAGVLSPTRATFPLATGEPAASPTTFAYAESPVAIPDALPAGVSVSIPVTGIGYASKLTFSIDGANCAANRTDEEVGIDHTWTGDLIVTLTSPDGRTVTLTDRDGGSGDDLCQVVFDDAAARSFSTATFSLAPFTGSWQPAACRLEDFLLQPVEGDWTLKVADVAARDTGSIRAVSLHITGFAQ